MSLKWFNKRPTGSEPKDLFDQWVVDELASLQPQNSPTFQVARRDSKGWSGKAAAGGSGGSSVIQCVITELFGAVNTSIDYIGVTQFNLEKMSLTGSQFFCAKSYNGRQPASELIDGNIVTYSNYNANLLTSDSQDNVRQAVYDAMTSVFQVVNNRYLAYPANGKLPAGSDISQYLIGVTSFQNQVGMNDPDGAPIRYVEVLPFRRWCFSPALNGGNQ